MTSIYTHKTPEEYADALAERLRALGCSEEYVAESIERAKADVVQVSSSFEANQIASGRS